MLKIDGCYYIVKPSDNLSITTTFNQMNLDPMNLLFSSVCSDISGKLSGQFQLTGSLTAPKLNRKGTIDKGKFKINYLNSCYKTTGNFKIEENYLYVHQINLYDDTSGHTTLSGHIIIQNWFPVMLSGHMEALHLLQTTQMHHPGFYGDLYATGTLQIKSFYP